MLFENTELGRLERYANDSNNGANRYLFANINAATLKKVLNSKKIDKDECKVGIEYQCKLPTGDFEPAKKHLTYKGLRALYYYYCYHNEISNLPLLLFPVLISYYIHF